MKKYLVLILAMVGMGAGLPNLSEAKDLDNTAWRIHEENKSDTEDLIFVNGQFTSSGCVPYGFVTGNYSSTKEGESIRWKATQINKDNEKMAWDGTAKGKEMSGIYVYTDKQGKTWTSKWTGNKLEAK